MMIALQRGRLVALLWLIIAMGVVIAAIRQGASFDTSLMALLPVTEQRPEISQAVDKLAGDFSGQVLLVISAAERDIARKAVAIAAKRLVTLSDIARVDWQLDDSVVAGDELYPFRFSVLSDAVRNRLLAGQGKQQYQLALQRLFSPLSGSVQDPIRDPFAFYADLQMVQQSGLQLTLEQGLFRLTSAKQPSYLIRLSLDSDPFSLPIQQRVLAAVDPLDQELELLGAQLYRSGLIWHAAAGAQQAKTEISTIGLGSLLGIVLLMLLVFKRISVLGAVLLPVLIGCLMASAVTLLIFGKIHLITLAFGAGLVGVSVDYALHFICERQVQPADRVVKNLFAGLLLGLVSSVIAYAALALAPFPGLRQMAVFSVTGLTAAWLTVLLWLPFISSGKASKALPSAALLNRWRKSYPRLESQPLLIVGFVVVSLSSLVIIWQGQPQDDIRLLQTSSTELLDEDRGVQQLLGNSSSSEFILITGASVETVLQIEERLLPALQALVDPSGLQGYQALSQVLPSLQRQSENHNLVRDLYRQYLPEISTVLRISEFQRLNIETELERGVNQLMTPTEWQQLQASEGWRSLLVSDTPGAVASVIRLKGTLDSDLKGQLKLLTDGEAGVYWVDRVDSISSLLSDYRQQIIQWLLIAYGLVLGLLAIRYRTNLWRIILPPLTASLITFAALILSDGGYNLFNLIALMLVLGIGLDMGIFLYESADSDHTWLAVSLSAVTSLLAFGLLTFSKTPVLYHFGVIVLPGLCLVWLIAPLMRRLQPEIKT
jgi:predicted exporter